MQFFRRARPRRVVTGVRAMWRAETFLCVTVGNVAAWCLAGVKAVRGGV